ncbi:hypothetical protein HVPorG_04928 [Roseomonas mucosa]|nr:hypothetical protein HVPorG_04928 [Roseomonas mucosa]
MVGRDRPGDRTGRRLVLMAPPPPGAGLWRDAPSLPVPTGRKRP